MAATVSSLQVESVQFTPDDTWTLSEVFYDLSKDEEAKKHGVQFVHSEIVYDEEKDEETCLAILNDKAFTWLRDYGCSAKILHNVLPEAGQNVRTFFFPMNKLQDANKNLSVDLAERDLCKKLLRLFDMGILKKKQTQLKVCSTNGNWYAFLILSDDVPEENAILAYTWFRKNFWDLKDCEHMHMYIKYADKKKRGPQKK
jgi:hypothetical protein